MMRKSWKHLPVLYTGIAELHILGVCQLPLQIVNGPKDQHLPAVVL